MSSASVKWIGGKQFIGVDSTNHSVVLSTPDEGIGMKPSELMLVALASCTAVDVVEILNKKRAGLTSLEISAVAEQEKNPPWTFRKIHLTYRLKGSNLSEKDAAQAIGQRPYPLELGNGGRLVAQRRIGLQGIDLRSQTRDHAIKTISSIGSLSVIYVPAADFEGRDAASSSRCSNWFPCDANSSRLTPAEPAAGGCSRRPCNSC